MWAKADIIILGLHQFHRFNGIRGELQIPWDLSKIRPFAVHRQEGRTWRRR